MAMYLVSYEYKERRYMNGSPIYQEVLKTTTRTFRFDELENIENHIETCDNHIIILSIHKL